MIEIGTKVLVYAGDMPHKIRKQYEDSYMEGVVVDTALSAESEFGGNDVAAAAPSMLIKVQVDLPAKRWRFPKTISIWSREYNLYRLRQDQNNPAA